MTKGPTPGKVYEGKCIYKVSSYKHDLSFEQTFFGHIKEQIAKAGFDMPTVIYIDFTVSFPVSLDNTRLHGEEMRAAYEHTLLSLYKLYQLCMKENKQIHIDVKVPFILGDAVLKEYLSDEQVTERVRTWREKTEEKIKATTQRFVQEYTKNTHLNISAPITTFSNFNDTELHREGQKKIQQMLAEENSLLKQIVEDTGNDYLSKTNQNVKPEHKKSLKQAIQYLFKECEYWPALDEYMSGKVIIQGVSGHKQILRIGGFYLYPAAALNPALQHVHHELELLVKYKGFRATKRNGLEDNTGTIQQLSETTTETGELMLVLIQEQRALKAELKQLAKQQRAQELKSFTGGMGISFIILLLMMWLFLGTRTVSGSSITNRRCVDEQQLPDLPVLPASLEEKESVECHGRGLMWQLPVSMTSQQTEQHDDDIRQPILSDGDFVDEPACTARVTIGQ